MMNYKNQSLIVLLLIGCMVNLNGQKDPEAEPYLEKFAGEFRPGSAIRINFDYSREDQQSGSMVEGDGAILLAGDKYKIDLGEAIIFYDGETQYAWQLEIEEVYISKPDPENREFTFVDPIRLLGDYQNTFKYRLIGISEIFGVSMREIQLYPVDLDAPYALIKLFFSLDDDTLKAIFIRQNQGILYTMMITEMALEEDPGKDHFRFNADENPQVEIIELIE